ncbi:PA24B phospholipase, partial [Hypocryptadius cinnamomeus]|nr:PA24B phospholipase [Hypocryptadius cinnamomeus]
NLDVRLEFDLCTEEKNFLLKRKKFVASALKKALHLEQDLEDHEVPVVAVMTTGGGTRALTSLLGNLLGLQKLGLLDAISYITGSSGSTCEEIFPNIQFKPLWAQLKPISSCLITCYLEEETNPHLSTTSFQEVVKSDKVFPEPSFLQATQCQLLQLLLKNNHKLSDEQEALSQGQNPLPIYMILNIKEDYSLSEFKEWVEFTPYEVGFLKYGAFIPAEDFGSEFFMGRLMKKLPESRICFMKGDVVYCKNLNCINMYFI